MIMEKTGVDNIVCVKCSNPAVVGTNPPLCADHMANTEKEASEEAWQEAEAQWDAMQEGEMRPV